MRTVRWITFLCLLAIIVSSNVRRDPAVAQDQACSLVAQNALNITEQVCATTGRNQVCYGHDQAAARPQPQVENLAFDMVGDIVDVTEVQSLRLSAMDVPSGIWGVVLMRLQASQMNLSDHNVTLLLFGDVKLDMAATEDAPVPDGITATTLFPISVRQTPSADASVVGHVESEQVVTVIGRLADNSWLRVWLPTGKGDGWVDASFLNIPDDLRQVEIVNPNTPLYGSLNAFYLRTGIDDSACPEAPDSGLLVQTPEGVAEVTLLINEVSVQLGSTVFFRAVPGKAMIVDVVEGAARIEVDGVARTAVAGTQVQVPINEQGQKTGPPAPLKPYEPKAVRALPVKLLDKPVEIPPPMDEEEVTSLNEVQEAQNPDPTQDAAATPMDTPTPADTPTEIPTDLPTEIPTLIPTATLMETPTFLPTNTAEDPATLTPIPTDDATANPTADATADPTVDATDDDADDGTGDTGTGDDGTGDDGTGDDDTGDTGTGDDGTGDDGTGDEGTGDDGTSDDGTGDEGTSDDGTGDDGTGDDGTGDDGTSDDGTGDDGTGDDSTDEGDTGDDGTNEG